MEASEATYLVEDGVQWLDTLISELGGEISSELDHLVILLHSFLIELGFSTLDGGIHPSPGWKSSNQVYILKYTLPPSTTPTCQIIATMLGQSVLKVHGIHLPDKTTFTLSTLKISNHIKTLDTKFISYNLRHLSRFFKNSIGLPLLQTSRSHLGLPTTGLLGLPPEVLLTLLRFLPLCPLLNLSSTCKQLNNATDDPSLWKRLCRQDFPGQNGEDWRQIYKNGYKAKKITERQGREVDELRNRGPPIFPFDPMFPHPSFGPDSDPDPEIGFPGMVGGDYDRFPLGGLGPLGRGGLGPFGRGGLGPFGRGGLGPFGRGMGPRFDPPGPNFPNMGPPRGGFGGGGGFGFM